MKNNCIRIPLRFRGIEGQDLYFKLRKLSNVKNKSLNTIIIDELKKLNNDEPYCIKNNKESGKDK